MATAGRRASRSTRALEAQLATARSLDEICPDRYRGFVFPNRVREHRQSRGLYKLMALSNKLADIPYIRLSKIERGEVAARADELIRIADVLGVAPEDLLIDIDGPDFDIATWAEPFHDPRSWDIQDERNAVLLGAALRWQRNKDRSLTIARLDQEFGLPAVILSRLENAQKPLTRWNDATLASICRLFNTGDVEMLVARLAENYLLGELDPFVSTITDPATRSSRVRLKVAELRMDLQAAARDADAAPSKVGSPGKQVKSPALEKTARSGPAISSGDHRQLSVLGAPLQGGLIAREPTGAVVDAPPGAGPRAFALRVCRATLGAGLPPSAVVIADPDRSATLGSLAAIRCGDAYRIVSVTLDRSGTTMGYSIVPDIAVNIDDLDPGDIAGIIAAVYP